MATADAIGHGTTAHGPIEDRLPQHRAVFGIERSEPADDIAGEEEIPSGGQNRPVNRRALLVGPQRLPGRCGNRLEAANGSRRGILTGNVTNPGTERVAVGHLGGLDRHRDIHTRVVHRHIHRAGVRAIGPGRLVLTALDVRAREDRRVHRVRSRGLIDDRTTGLEVDPSHDVLVDGRSGPQELTGRSVQRPHDSGLARDTGDDLSNLT